MIPKILHLCWLSEGPMPQKFEDYIQSWRDKLPDYEIRKWDFNRFPKQKSLWVAEAFDNRKFAFAADYIRCYALYHEGGIYLDADVQVLQRFDDLLDLPYFFGFENGSGLIDAGILAAEKGSDIFKLMLEYYKDKHFVNPDNTLNTTPLPCVLKQVLSPHYTIKPIENKGDFDHTQDVISVLPFDFFSPIHQETRKLEVSDRTIAIHHFAASWQSGWPRYRRIIKKAVGPNIYSYLIKIKRFFIPKPNK